MVKASNFIINSDFPALAQAFQINHTVTSHIGTPISSEKWREDYIDIVVPNANTIQRININNLNKQILSEIIINLDSSRT